RVAPHVAVFSQLKLSHPVFSHQAQPASRPAPSLVTPYAALAQLPVVAHDRLHQPTFSPQIQPVRPSSRTSTPGPPSPSGSTFSHPTFSPYANWSPVPAGS